MQRLKSIVQGVSQKSKDDLKKEAESQFSGSTTDRLKCPRCRRPMLKQSSNLPVIELHTDVCHSCELVWLDGGELALLQLGYQATSKFLDTQEFKRRMEELEASPERKAQFEKNLAALPKEKLAVEQILPTFVVELFDLFAE